MVSLFITLSLLAGLTAAQQTETTICPEAGYELGEDSSLCYSYKESSQTFFGANRSCVREGAILLDILSASEHDYIRRRFFERSGVEFWLSLNDIDDEGVFRWINSSLRDPSPSYTNWSTGEPTQSNSALSDCVKFTRDGWTVHSLPCGSSSLPFICKMFSCRSNNNEHCIGSEPTVAPSGVSATIVIVIVVLLLLVIIAIVVIVVLLIMWKFCNAAFNRYCCCCLSGGAKSNVHSLQQENQRLRHELSQHKLSTSGRYSQGQFARELSGVPDGRGGVLPTIKAPLSPSIPENQPLTFGTSPPPLVPQRISTTRITPIRHHSTVATPLSGTTGPPFGVFTSGVKPVAGLRRQSAPVVVSKPKMIFPTTTTKIEEEKKEVEDVTSSEDESDHSAHQKTDKGTTE